MTKAEQTRAFIIEKVAPIFNTKGYAGTSLGDMTEATGLTKGSIYGNFENKDEVALAVFDHNLQKVNSIIKSEVFKRSTAKDQLLAYVQVYDNYSILPFPVGGCPVLNTAIDADDTHPELKKKALEAVMTWKNSIVNIVKKGIESKEIKKNTDPEQVALTMIAMIEGAIMITRLTGKPSYRKLIMESVEKLIHDLG